MIKYFLVFVSVALFLYTPVNAQVEKFKGIGVFKIGSDTSVVYEFAKAKKIKIKHCNTSKEYVMKGYNNSKDILRLFDNTKKPTERIFDLSYCPYAIQFSIPSYDVAGIIIKKIKLVFYKNRLVRFESEYDKAIKEAMDMKYGKSKLEVTRDTVNCFYKITGNTVGLIAQTFANRWDNDRIRAFSMLWEYYDDNCQKEIHGTFQYSEETGDLEHCDKITKDAVGNKKMVAKDKIKDF